MHFEHFIHFKHFKHFCQAQFQLASLVQDQLKTEISLIIILIISQPFQVRFCWSKKQSWLIQFGQLKYLPSKPPPSLPEMPSQPITFLFISPHFKLDFNGWSLVYSVYKI